MKEGDNLTHTYLTTRSYYPYYGRGLIQLTWKDTYKDYGEFRKFPRINPTGIFHAIGWDPDVLIARDNTNYHVINCADSACWFVNHKPRMLASVDHGISQSDAITVSKFVNGNVDIQNLNGLEIRVQSLMFLRDALLNTPADGSTEAISLSWRRKSQPEPTGQLDARGQMKMSFFLKEPPWQLQVPLNKQRP
jgi:hydroxyethylthiazole kinase